MVVRNMSQNNHDCGFATENAEHEYQEKMNRFLQPHEFKPLSMSKHTNLLPTGKRRFIRGEAVRQKNGSMIIITTV